MNLVLCTNIFKYHLVYILTFHVFLAGGIYRIVGGRESRPHSRPYIASVQDRGGHFCGGALIQCKWVLTAAHCMESRSVNSIRVVLGAHKLDAPEQYVQVFSVRRSIQHPKYNRTFFVNDIQLLKLNESAIISIGVRPIRLPCKTSTLTPRTTCTVAGWGRVSDLGVKPPALMEADVRVISQETCRKSWNGIFSSMMCTATPGKVKGSCRGDSGGPLVCRNRMEGLVSFSGKYCGNPVSPDVYTSVSFFLPWILEVIQRS
ncbi:serine protease 57 [Spea bombifrons]|uniref:serine protease 57 n=1 Tax=Spea bombifrons TaxID=233779 RepID=UPI00234AAD6D|nr:serine protease 57 [Spea bombifrons]